MSIRNATRPHLPTPSAVPSARGPLVQRLKPPFRVRAAGKPVLWSATSFTTTAYEPDAGVFDHLHHAQARADLMTRTLVPREFHVIDSEGAKVPRDNRLMDAFYRDPIGFEARFASAAA